MHGRDEYTRYWSENWKGSLGRCKCKGEESIKMDFREIGLEGVDLIHLA